MKRTNTLLILSLAGAVCATAFLLPVNVPDRTEPQQSVQVHKQQKTEVVLDGKVIHIVPPSSEAARIPPGLLAELKAAGEL